jgi:hypothetical protein
MAEMTVPLRSSNVAGVSAYDDETSEFTVFFVSGGEYVVEGAPKSVYAGLVSAESPGRYYNSQIRNTYLVRRES